MSSSVWISGESPPWTQRNCWFIRAARGKQSNASMQESYTCSEYLILPGDGRMRTDTWFTAGDTPGRVNLPPPPPASLTHIATQAEAEKVGVLRTLA